MFFAYFICFVLNASFVEVSPIEKLDFSPIQNIDRIGSIDVEQNSTPYFAKGFRPSRGGSAKPAFKRKGKPSKPQSKAGEKDAPKGSHDKNQRESNREKHENADARRQKEQKKAEEKRDQNKKNK